MRIKLREFFWGLLAWTFYGLGVAWDTTMQWSYDNKGVGWTMFSIMQWLFAMSDRCQVENGFGPWREVE